MFTGLITNGNKHETELSGKEYYRVFGEDVGQELIIPDKELSIIFLLPLW